jgi:hypothetical protein
MKTVTNDSAKLKALLELVKASPIMLIKGEFRMDKKVSEIRTAQTTARTETDYFKLILSLDNYMAPGGEKAVFQIAVPINNKESYRIGDMAIFCPNAPHDSSIRVVFDLHYENTFEDHFLLDMTPQTMGVETPESHYGRFEIKPEADSPCVTKRFFDF